MRSCVQQYDHDIRMILPFFLPFQTGFVSQQILHWTRMETLTISFTTPAKVRIKPDPTLIKNTAATFKENAMEAFAKKTRKPIRPISRKGARPSVKGMMQALMIAQTYGMTGCCISGRSIGLGWGICG